jgi:DNA-binding MarR family transcriptional regulator
VLALRAYATGAVLFHGALAERLGLSATDLRTVDLLARLGPMTAGQLGEETGLRSASVTALIDRLEHRGFVRRVRDPGDRRRVFVEVASEGVARIGQLYDALAPSLSRMWDDYSPEQLETIRDFLARGVASARDAIGRLRRLPR